MTRPAVGPPADAGDAGSTMIIAVVVMMILSTLSLAGLARTLSELAFTQHGQQYDDALAMAEQGVADAMYQLQHGATTPASSYTNGIRSWRYRTASVSANEVDIFAVGQVAATQHGVRARATRTPLYKYALFSLQSLALDSSQLALDAYSFLTLGSTADTGAALIGTNGDLSCTGSGNFGAAQHHFRSVNAGCPHPVQLSQPELFPPPVAPAGTCPPDTLGTVVLTGVIDGNNGTPMVCKKTGTVTSVKITGTVSVIRPPFVLYVDNGLTLDLSTAVINAGGSAANVVIQKIGSDTVTLEPAVPLVGTPAAISFSGVLYAPQVDLSISGSHWWTGSIIANSFKVTGNPILRVGYDLGLQTQTTQNWVVSRWAEAPAASLNVP